MYSKNPVTQKLDSYAFQSDLEKVDKLILKAGERGNVSSGTITLVEEAEVAAGGAATAASGAREAVDKLNTEDIPTAQGQYTAMYDKVYGSPSDPGGLEGAVKETCETVQGNEPVVAGVVGVTEKNTGDMNAFLDSYVATTVRIADPDQLQEIGAMAHEVNGDVYPYSHCETASELAAAGFVCSAEMNEDAVDSQGKAYKNNLMSFNDIDGGLQGTQNVHSWSIPLPSLRDVDIYLPLANRFVNIESFDGALPNLVNGGCFFYNTNLSEWTAELPSLVSGAGDSADGEGMFCNTDLSSWDVALPRLKYGWGMFYGCKKLVSFETPLPRLIDGTVMFTNCTSLTDCNITLPSLENGTDMFAGCTSLGVVGFTLPSLKKGSFMFDMCKIEFESACNILNSLPNVNGDAESDKTFTIGMLGAKQDGTTDGTCCLELTPVGSPYSFKRKDALKAAVKKAKEQNGWGGEDGSAFVEQYYYPDGTLIVSVDPSLD